VRTPPVAHQCITIAFHDSPGSPPGMLVEMCVPTAKFIQDVSAAGMVRVTLKCDKKQQQQRQFEHQQAGEAGGGYWTSRPGRRR
jgi:hypothetical protein